MDKKKQLERTTKSKLGEECLNCEKKGYYAKDYRFSTSNKRKPEELIGEAKRFQWKKNKVKITRSNEQDNSDPEPYPTGQAFIARKVDED